MRGIHVLTLSEKAELAIRLVRESKELSFDTETSGLDWKVNNPIGWVFYAEGAPQSIYVPTRHGGGGNLAGGKPLDRATDPIEVHPFEKELARAFDDRNRTMPDGLVIGHHTAFDAKFAWNVGVMLGRNMTCTQNREALVNEYTKSFALSALSDKYGVTAKKGEELYEHLSRLFGGPSDRKSMQHFWRTSGSDPLVVDYAEGDGVSTLEVFHEQKKAIIKDELESITKIEDELIWTLVRMERRGIKVDTNYLDRFIGVMEQRVKDAFGVLPEGFNPRSPNNVRDWMVSKGHTDWPTTAKGNPSFTEKWLKNSEAGQAVLAVRKNTNMLNSFAVPLRDEHTVNGRVHATLNQNKMDDKGTISGRLSCSHPNLQQVPKHNAELAVPLRRAFVPDEGYEIYEADWSQAEPRLFAHYSQSKQLLDGYNSTPFRDVHTLVAELLDVDRSTTGKRMNMGIFTGMQIPTFSAHMGLPQSEAGQMWHAWYREFPEVRTFQNKAKSRILNRGYVKTLLGRRGRLEERRFAYKATSKIIQGGQADMMKYKMVELDKILEAWGDEIHLQMQIHDALLWQAPATDKGRKQALEIKDVMADVQTEPFNLSVPFVSDFDFGLSWAEASFGKKKMDKYMEGW